MKRNSWTCTYIHAQAWILNTCSDVNVNTCSDVNCWMFATSMSTASHRRERRRQTGIAIWQSEWPTSIWHSRKSRKCSMTVYELPKGFALYRMLNWKSINDILSEKCWINTRIFIVVNVELTFASFVKDRMAMSWDIRENSVDKWSLFFCFFDLCKGQWKQGVFWRISWLTILIIR